MPCRFGDNKTRRVLGPQALQPELYPERTCRRTPIRTRRPVCSLIMIMHCEVKSMQENTSSVQFVTGMRSLAFDFGV
eukprot:3596432-Rhodomonas_salina.1